MFLKKILNLSTFTKAYVEGIYNESSRNKSKGINGLPYKNKVTATQTTEEKKEEEFLNEDKLKKIKNTTDEIFKGTKRINCLNQE